MGFWVQFILDFMTILFQGKERLHYVGEILKRSFISTVGPTVRADPSRKRSSSASADFENAGFFFVWTKKMLEKDFLENDGVTINM